MDFGSLTVTVLYNRTSSRTTTAGTAFWMGAVGSKRAVVVPAAMTAPYFLSASNVRALKSWTRPASSEASRAFSCLATSK